METQTFWHWVALAGGAGTICYALAAREFRHSRIFTSGERTKFTPRWYDRAWLVVIGTCFFILSIRYFIRH